jgi:hypothetical protein
LNIYNLIYNIPVPVKKQITSSQNVVDSKRVQQSSSKSSTEEVVVKQVVLRPPSAKSKTLAVVQPKRPASKHVSSKQKEIDMVRNLPAVKVIKEPVQEIITSIVSEIQPISENDQVGNVSISIPDDTENIDELAEDTSSKDASVTWRVVNEHHPVSRSNITEVSVKQPVSAHLVSGNYGIKHEKSKKRFIDRLLCQKEDIETKIKQISEECIRPEVSKQKFDEIVQFYVDLEDETNIERIQQFVFGRISYEYAEVLDKVREIKDMKLQIYQLEKQVAELLATETEND